MVNFYKIADSVIEKSRHDGIPTYLTPTNYELMVAAVRAGYDAAAIEQWETTDQPDRTQEHQND